MMKHDMIGKILSKYKVIFSFTVRQIQRDVQ